jgi:hypothetical protein
MSARLIKRLEKLENAGPVIATFADYVKWHYNGRDPSVRWDPAFRAQMEELAKSADCSL